MTTTTGMRIISKLMRVGDDMPITSASLLASIEIDAAIEQARREGAEAMRARIVDITRERAKAMAPVGRAVLGTMAGLIEVLDAPPAPADSAQRGGAA